MIREKIQKELDRVIIGQKGIIDNLLISIFTGSHTLIIGVPGLAKTLLVNALAKTLGMKFSRIQFTPDLMPADITGTEILQESNGKKEFKFIKGPVFSNLVLADEINRAPPKTQSALLEAMQEKRVTFAGKTYRLDEPFIVIATQNPIEQEGTYPLPEAQLDRFMFSLHIDYPEEESERLIVARGIVENISMVKEVVSKKELKRIKEEIKSMPVSEEALDIVMNLLKETRPQTSHIDEVKKYVEWGVSPRGGQYLLLGAKAHAYLDGRPTPSPEDIKQVVHLVFDHRIITNFLATAEGIKPEDIVDIVVKYVYSHT